MSEPISLRALELSVKALEIGLQEQAQYPHLLTVRDGVIQRFEMAMDLARQVVIRVLKEVYRLDEASAKRGWIREAAKLGMLVDVESWFGFLSARDRTSHTYDSKIAAEVFGHIPVFLIHAHDLLNRLPNHVA